MVTVKASQDPKNFLNDIIESAHSRFPVIGDSQDDVIGVLLAKDLLPLALSNDLNWNHIREILRPHLHSREQAAQPAAQGIQGNPQSHGHCGG